MCANFQAKQTTSTFLAQICPEIDFWVEILTIMMWIRNQHLQDTMCANFRVEQTTLTFSAPIFPKNGFTVGNS